MAQYAKKKIVRATEVVQIPLLPEHAPKIETAVQRVDAVFEELTSLCQEGYNLTIAYDTDRKQWNTRLAGIEEHCTNSGKLLYANGEELKYALAALWVKHFLVSGASSWETSNTNTSKYS